MSAPLWTHLLLTILLALAVAQVVVLSAALRRRHVPPAAIRAALPPLAAIWVLFWPLYAQSFWLLAGIFLLALPATAAALSRRPFWRLIAQAWGDPEAGMVPLLLFLAGLTIAALFFIALPEVGLGVGLTLALAPTLAELLDRRRFTPLGFPANRGQTLPGHIAFVLAATMLCGWSLHVFHPIAWLPLLTAAAIAALAASMLRALTPALWLSPVAALTLGGVLWLL